MKFVSIRLHIAKVMKSKIHPEIEIIKMGNYSCWLLIMVGPSICVLFLFLLSEKIFFLYFPSVKNLNLLPTLRDNNTLSLPLHMAWHHSGDVLLVCTGGFVQTQALCSCRCRIPNTAGLPCSIPTSRLAGHAASGKHAA